MMCNMRFKLIGFVSCSALFFGLLAGGCSSSTPSSSSSPPPLSISPILQFGLMGYTGNSLPNPPLPTHPLVTMLFPTDIPNVNPGQNIYVNTINNPNFSGDRTLLKMTLTSKYNNQEVPLILPAGPVGEGIPNLPEAFVAPNDAGVYEVDLYYKDSIVAAASFVVNIIMPSY